MDPQERHGNQESKEETDHFCFKRSPVSRDVVVATLCQKPTLSSNALGSWNAVVNLGPTTEDASQDDRNELSSEVQLTFMCHT